uniref:hypothetical protein n=1 Tax=Aeromonas sp. HMWF015 TaxID=2056851 RepID=UPI000D485D0C
VSFWLKAVANYDTEKTFLVFAKGALQVDSEACQEVVTIKPLDIKPKVVSVDALPSSVLAGQAARVKVTLDKAYDTRQNVFVKFILGSADDGDLTDTDIHIVEGATGGGGLYPNGGYVGVNPGSDSFTLSIPIKDDRDPYEEVFHISANVGTSYDATGAVTGEVKIVPIGRVGNISVTPSSVTEGKDMLATVYLDARRPVPQPIWVGLKPSSAPRLMIEKEDISLGAITGGSIVEAGGDGLSWRVLVDANTSQISFPLITLLDGDVEQEQFIISANPGEDDSSVGRAESSELTIIPATSPVLEFTNIPQPGRPGEIGGAALTLDYGLSLSTGTPVPLNKKASEDEVAMHLLQRASRALKLSVVLSDIPSEQVDGRSYCTLASDMGPVAVPLTFEQGNGGSTQSIDCAGNSKLELTLPSSGSGWVTAASNQYTTTLSVIATMNDPVSAKTVSGGSWFGQAVTVGRLTARASME